MDTSKAKVNKKAQQRAKTTEKILFCALNLFVTNGYLATTIEAVADDANVTKGAIYFYFKTKEEILTNLLNQAEQYVVDPIKENVGPPELAADVRLLNFISKQSLLGLLRPQHVMLLIFMSIEFSAIESEPGRKVRAIYRRMYNAIREILEQGQSEGVFRNDLSSDVLISIVMAGHDGVLIDWYRRPHELDGKKLANALRLTLLDGVKNRNNAEPVSAI